MPGVEDSGFYCQEYDQNSQPFRWTNGKARLVIPIDPENPPRGLAMQIFFFRPPMVKTIRLQILVNNRELFNHDIPPWKWEKTLDLSGLELGEEMTLDIFSDTFLPKGIMDHGANQDSRKLGVQVRSIKLVPEEVKPAPRDPRIIDAPAQVWPEHPQGICCGGISADGKILVSGCKDGTIKIWDVLANKECDLFPELVPNLLELAVSPDGQTFATAAADRLVSIWDTRTAKLKKECRGHKGQITSLAFSPDGRTLASAGGDRNKTGELKLWDSTTGKERVPVDPFPFRLWSLSFAPEGKRVAVAGGDRTVQIMDNPRIPMATSNLLTLHWKGAHHHRAFTLIEMLIVIAIIGVLVAMLLPALQQARLSANTLACKNNLRQIGMALHNFHNFQRVFPSNGGWDGKQTIPATDGTMFTPATFDFTTNQLYKWGTGMPDVAATDQTGSWGYAILPFIEQKAMYQQRQWTYGVGLYICPARRGIDAKTVVAQDAWGIYGGWEGGRTDYGVNLQAFDNRPICHSIARFFDGLSNTVLVGEKAYDAAIQRKSWYYDESFFLGGSKGTSRGAVGLSRDGPGVNYKDNWGSPHVEGVLFLFGDGNVRLLSFDIEPLMAALLNSANFAAYLFRKAPSARCGSLPIPVARRQRWMPALPIFTYRLRK